MGERPRLRFDVIEGESFTAFREAAGDYWVIEGPNGETGWGAYHARGAAVDAVFFLDAAYALGLEQAASDTGESPDATLGNA